MSFFASQTTLPPHFSNCPRHITLVVRRRRRRRRWFTNFWSSISQLVWLRRQVETSAVSWRSFWLHLISNEYQHREGNEGSEEFTTLFSYYKCQLGRGGVFLIPALLPQTSEKPSTLLISLIVLNKSNLDWWRWLLPVMMVEQNENFMRRETLVIWQLWEWKKNGKKRDIKNLPLF